LADVALLAAFGVDAGGDAVEALLDGRGVEPGGDRMVDFRREAYVLRSASNRAGEEAW
jgi:hypothetical protein